MAQTKVSAGVAEEKLWVSEDGVRPLNKKGPPVFWVKAETHLPGHPPIAGFLSSDARVTRAGGAMVQPNIQFRVTVGDRFTIHSPEPTTYIVRDIGADGCAIEQIARQPAQTVSTKRSKKVRAA